MAEPARKRTAKAKTRPLKHAAPEGLGAAGADLWQKIVAELEDGWRFDERELYLLQQAAHNADMIADLEAAVEADGVTATGSRGQPVVNPAITEIRQLDLAQIRLLGALELTDPDGSVPKSATPHQKRTMAAAERRAASRRR